MPPPRAPVPPGWPGDDPTVPDDLALLGGHRRRARHRRDAARPAGRTEGAAVDPAEAVDAQDQRRRTAPDAPSEGPDAPGRGEDRDGDLGDAPADRSVARRSSWLRDRAARRFGALVGAAGRSSTGVASPPLDEAEEDDSHGRVQATGDDVGVGDPLPHELATDDDLGEEDPLGDEQDDLVAGRQPAGRVLVVLVAALVLAMLVNADALVERAERQPAGPERDRALAVWHPVQDVSHVLQLHRIRQAADWIAGDSDDSDDTPSAATDDSRRRPADDGARETTPTTGTTDTSEASATPGAGGATDEAPDVRTPTADEPLRLWIGGDSMTQLVGPSLAAAAEATGVVEPAVATNMASGLTRPDYFDWPARLRADLAADDPDVLVVAFGINDGQGIVLQDGTPIPEVSDPRWTTEYRRRVAALMDQLRASDRLVAWVLPPPMRDADYAARIAVIRDAVVAEAATRPWILTVDPAASVADPSGAYADAVPDANGTPVPVRQGDGIHVSQAGADLVSAQVLEAIGTRVDLSGTAD